MSTHWCVRCAGMSVAARRRAVGADWCLGTSVRASVRGRERQEKPDAGSSLPVLAVEGICVSGIVIVQRQLEAQVVLLRVTRSARHRSSERSIPCSAPLRVPRGLSSLTSGLAAALARSASPASDEQPDPPAAPAPRNKVKSTTRSDACGAPGDWSAQHGARRGAPSAHCQGVLEWR